MFNINSGGYRVYPPHGKIRRKNHSGFQDIPVFYNLFCMTYNFMIIKLNGTA